MASLQRPVEENLQQPLPAAASRRGSIPPSRRSCATHYH
ncbi:Hypothetical protein ABZS17G119_03172 [Kosakonia cowanii]